MDGKEIRLCRTAGNATRRQWRCDSGSLRQYDLSWDGDDNRRSDDPTGPWVAMMLRESEAVRERLERDPEEAVALLEEWKEQTRANLRWPKD